MAPTSPNASPPNAQTLTTISQKKELAFGERWENAAKPIRPSISGGAGVDADGRRKSSVMFNTVSAEDTIRRESVTMPSRPSNATRRMSSPPPPKTYQRGVSFDTFDNKDATDYSFTLNYKHKDYHNTRRSRTFLCGTDQKDYSEFALEWLIDELIDDGDEIVCLRVVEKDSRVASDSSIEHGKYKDEAQKLLESVIKKNSQEEKAISLVMELAVGRVQEIIQRMIQIYEPAVLIVGTRGRNMGGMQGLMPGSVSKYCLQQSPIPVIVVRPSNKRLRKKKKRLADPNHHLYGSILEQAERVGGQHVLERSMHNSVSLPEATDQEAAAVAKAIGLPKYFPKGSYGGPLARVTSTKSDYSSDPDSPPTEGFLPAGLLRSLVPDRADKIANSPMLKALTDSNWDDDDSVEGVAIDEKDGSDGDMLSPQKRDERRSSHGPPPDWLNEILKKPEKPMRAAHNRSLSG